MSRSTILGTILVTALSPARLDAQQQPFTLEQALSAPFPEELVAAPAGGAIAWVYNAQGARNLWIATPPEYQGRAVTAYTEDDGQELGELAWTPDARALVYVRGGASNSRGEYPNPLSLPAGVEQGLWIVAAAGGPPRRLGEGHSPVVSPKGDRVAYLKQGQVWWVPLADSAKPEQLVHARGTAQALRWSPDGAKLAFASGRGDHGFIGVYDVAAKTLRFLDPSVDRDVEPVWSPDGAQIAFIRIPAAEPTLPFTPRRVAPPWSIRVADVATGRGREVWRADAGRGSAFREIVAENQLLWGAGSRLVFPWEKDGWTHLYAVPLSGGAAALLTPGAFEVEHVTRTPDGREVVFSSNQDDLDRRHVWRVSVAGGKPQAVTSGTGIEWAPAVASDGKAVALLRADARKPPRPAILTGSGPARELAAGAIPADFPEAALVEPQQVLLSASDGVIVHGQLFLPRNLRPGERRLAARDAARLALPLLLSQRLRAEPVPCEPGVHRAFGELPQRHRLWAGVSRGAALRGAGCERVRRRARRGAVPARPRRRGSEAHRPVGRLLRRIPHCNGPRPRLGPVCGRRRPARRASVERGDPQLGAGLRPGAARRLRQARARVVADRVRQGLALPGAADPGGRRPQRAVQPDGRSGGGAAAAGRRGRAARVPRRGARFPDARALARRLSRGRGVSGTKAGGGTRRGSALRKRRASTGPDRAPPRRGRRTPSVRWRAARRRSPRGG